VELNILNEVAALQRLSIGQLRQRFAELFGEATKASNRTWLIKRIAWRLQALAEGDLSERARQRAAELARDADLRLNPPQCKANTTTMKTNPAGRGTQTIPADPAILWESSKRILFHVARKVCHTVRLQLQGHGRGEAEAEELVHDAFLCLMEALPRFNPTVAKLTTFVYALARRRMWLVARAAFYGLSPEQRHRLDTA
jgi:hypothetical protein